MTTRHLLRTVAALLALLGPSRLAAAADAPAPADHAATVTAFDGHATLVQPIVAWALEGTDIMGETAGLNAAQTSAWHVANRDRMDAFAKRGAAALDAATKRSQALDWSKANADVAKLARDAEAFALDATAELVAHWKLRVERADALKLGNAAAARDAQIKGIARAQKASQSMARYGEEGRKLEAAFQPYRDREAAANKGKPAAGK